MVFSFTLPDILNTDFSLSVPSLIFDKVTFEKFDSNTSTSELFSEILILNPLPSLLA